MSRNYVRIQGNLGKKPEIKETKDGREYATFSVAVSERFYDTNASQWVETEAKWFKGKAWEPLEVNTAKNLEKGAIVDIEGRLDINEYEDKEGKKHHDYEITVTDLSEIVRQKKAA
jgi:single-strand DNA-binding protein